MYVNDKSTSQHAPRAPISSDRATKRTDPKFVRESFTKRKMHSWQIAGLLYI